MEWEGEGEDSQGDRDSDDVPGTELHIQYLDFSTENYAVRYSLNQEKV